MLDTPWLFHYKHIFFIRIFQYYFLNFYFQKDITKILVPAENISLGFPFFRIIRIPFRQLFVYQIPWINKANAEISLRFDEKLSIRKCAPTHLACTVRERMNGQEINYFLPASIDPLACHFTVDDQKPAKENTYNVRLFGRSKLHCTILSTHKNSTYLSFTVIKSASRLMCFDGRTHCQ